MALRELEEGIRQLQLRQGENVAQLRALVEQLAGTAHAGTTAERDALYSTATAMERLWLANRRVVWLNTETGWQESYYMPADTAGLTVRGLVAGTAAGWYPTGRGPRVVLAPSSPKTLSTGLFFDQWAAPGVGWSHRVGGPSWFNVAGGFVYAKRAGRYRCHVELAVQPGAGSGILSLAHTSPVGQILAGISQDTKTLNGSYPVLFQLDAADFRLAVDESLRVYASAVGSAQFAPSADANGRALFSASYVLEYLGPALVSD